MSGGERERNLEREGERIGRRKEAKRKISDIEIERCRERSGQRRGEGR